MTKAEFVEATNLANLRIARAALEAVFIGEDGSLRPQLEAARDALDVMVERHVEIIGMHE